ncbi:hypothetical protein LCGC14_2748200, partial [marine sediment metagenome]
MSLEELRRKINEADASYLQMVCDSLTDLVLVEGIGILLEKTVAQDKQLVLAAGSGLIEINEDIATLLHSRLAEEVHRGKEALLDSAVESPLKYSWPENIKSI